MEIPIVGGAYLGRSKNINSQLCQNLYPVVDQNGKKPAALFSTPGLTEWVTVNADTEIRGMIKTFSVLYVVAGDTVYWYNTAGTKTTVVGATLDNASGKVFMAYSYWYIMIVDPVDGNGYYIDLSLPGPGTLVKITDADFPTATSLTYQDGYFIVTEENTEKVYINTIDPDTGVGDPNDWNGSDWASAEIQADFALVAMSLLRELWIFGGDSIEIWYNNGDADYPFALAPGGIHERGIGAVHSVAKADNSLFFLGDDLSVYQSQALAIKRVSTQQIDFAISELTTTSDAIGYTYTMEGTTFYVLSFPTDDKTFVYDSIIGVWHTRASSVNENMHPANCYEYFNGLHLVGHPTNGKLLYYDFDNYTDDGDMLIRRRRCQAVDAQRKLTFHSCLEVEFEAGTGLITGQGSDPQAMLRWSDDGGHQWSNEHWTTIGAIGKYRNRARWKKLGMSRERIYEVAVSDPIKVVLISAYLDAKVGMY